MLESGALDRSAILTTGEISRPTVFIRTNIFQKFLENYIHRLTLITDALITDDDPYNGRFFGNFRKLYIKNDLYSRNDPYSGRFFKFPTVRYKGQAVW